jgi:hypothetical protein
MENWRSMGGRRRQPVIAAGGFVALWIVNRLLSTGNYTVLLSISKQAQEVRKNVSD